MPKMKMKPYGLTDAAMHSSVTGMGKGMNGSKMPKKKKPMNKAQKFTDVLKGMK